MSRAATAGEIAKFAGDGQYSGVRAIISNPGIAFAARINQANIKYDRLNKILYDTVTTGAYTNIVPGMTVMFGSSAGGWDHGIWYIRKPADTIAIYPGVTSELSLLDNDYITVLYDFAIWPKKTIYTTDGITYTDYDDVYVDQMRYTKPIIMAGGDRVLELITSTISTTLALSGYGVDGSTISSWVTTCTGATITSGTTNSPILTFTTTGEYLAKITATASNGKTSSTYRTIFVQSQTAGANDVVLSNNTCDLSGWSASVTMYADVSSIRPRAKVIIFARDYYGDTLGSIGALPGCENIIMQGWILGESITFDVLAGAVSFDIKQPGYWLDQSNLEQDVTVKNVSGIPASWHEMQSLTVNKMIWNMLANYTTALNCADFTLTGLSMGAGTLVSKQGSLWSMSNGFAADKLGAYLATNAYGQIYACVDTPLIPYADRSSIPTVVTLTAADWQSIDVTPTLINPTSQVILIGTSPDEKTMCGIGGGTMPDGYGTPKNINNGMRCSSQAQLSMLAGSIYARDNCPIRFKIHNMRGNNRLIDITPNQRVGLTLMAADSISGIAYSGNIIVRSISRSLVEGAWTIDLEADAETVATRYCDGTIPVTKDPKTPPYNFPFPDIPPFNPPFPPDVHDPPQQKPDPSTCIDSSPATGPYSLAWSSNYLDGMDTAKLKTVAYQNCVIRDATATNQTLVKIEIYNRGLAYNHLTLYAINAVGDHIATATSVYSDLGGNWYMMESSFSLVSPLAVSGFSLEIDAGFDAGDGSYLWVEDYLHRDPANPLFDPCGTYTFAGGVASYTTSVLAYDVVNGVFEFQVLGHLALTGFPQNAQVLTTPYFAKLSGSTGSLYVSKSLTYSGSGLVPWIDKTPPQYAPVSAVEVLGNIHGYGDFGGWTGDNQNVNIVPPGLPISYPSTDINFILTLFYCFSGSLPQRNATLLTGQLYNVCPAVAS